MKPDDELHAGDPCPICGGEFVPDPDQNPETQIENKNLNTPNPAAAQRYEKQVRTKVDSAGVIHKCLNCGYRARFKTADADRADRAADDKARESRDRTRDERDTKAREDREREEREREARERGTGDEANGTTPAAAGAGSERARRRSS